MHGTAFEFLRHEALNARNFFASTNPVKPQFRRNQFGGVAGGPIRKDRDVLLRRLSGPAADDRPHGDLDGADACCSARASSPRRSAAACRSIYDPATTTPRRRRRDAQPFPGNTIPVDRIDPVARTLLERYPLPTSAGTANNYRRVGNETVDQDQFSLRIDHRSRRTAIRLFGAADALQRELHPGDAAARRQRRDHRHARAAGHDGLVVRVELPAHVLEPLLNELRVGDTRRTRRTHGAAADRLGRRPVWACPAFPSTRSFPNTLPTFLIAGYQQLGSPPNTATDFSTSVTEIADTLTWLKGRHTIKVGADLRWERLNVIQPPSPTGSFTFSNLFTDLPGTANTGTPFASFLLGPGAAVLDRPAAGADPQPRALPGVLRPGRLAARRTASRSTPACATR